MSKEKEPAFPLQRERVYAANGITKLEYVATHIHCDEATEGADACWSEKILASLNATPKPVYSEGPLEYLKWWAATDAKLRVLKAKAILAECEANHD